MNTSRKGGKGKRKSEINGNVQSSSQEFRTARRATLDEIKGVMPEKRRRTISKEQSVPKSKRAASPASAKQQCEAYVKPEEEPTSKEEKLLTPIKDERKPPSPAKSPVKEERLRSPLAEKPSKRRSSEAKASTRSKRVSDLREANTSSTRAGSYDSDEGSARIRFLRLKKKKKGNVEVVNGTNSSSTDDDRVYKLQQGHEVERIVGLNREGSRLLYVVLYKGTSPKHQRMEYVPSKILRSHAMETFVDFLEQLVIQSTVSTEVTLTPPEFLAPGYSSVHGIFPLVPLCSAPKIT
ncbi:hypothetical protein Y032_0057g2758 [Ancylostoma ceylanicum]|uniref:Chromo shadow domain-containing protein n=1 Tax=Ancylostoma ceylanicum TaxID=53326 RepID=A0A016U4N1_9BILA|nr:hypothetical protein Y032_0057g2758 [Ancylostoma ceylanicum]